MPSENVQGFPAGLREKPCFLMTAAQPVCLKSSVSFCQVIAMFVSLWNKESCVGVCMTFISLHDSVFCGV